MLTTHEKNELSKTYASTCKIFDKVLEPDVLRMMVEDLSDLDYNQILTALNQYRRDEKNTQWPRASKIRAIVNPKQSTESLANEAASRVRSAITKFGWCNPSQAKDYIGDLGWEIVTRSGGWGYVCENHGLELNPLTFHAQARDLAKSIIESAHLGKHDQPIQIPDSNKQQISNVTKLITIKGI